MQNSNSKILSSLNKSQKKAVQTIEGPVLIVAGAGSGKTRVLTHRIAYLIENGIPPYSILALTFTNKAAGEMRERLASLVPEEHSAQIWAGTFHSLFARILRYEAEHIGFSSSFSIYDSDDSLSIVKKILNELNISNQQISAQSARSQISWAKNHLVTVNSFAKSAYTSTQKICSDLYSEYEKRLIANNAMDFDDLLLNMIKLLKSSQEILTKYQNRFQYLLIDEFQDTNKPQFEVIKLLSENNNNICVVGDDAQSIYRWRGAEIKNILEFQKIFEGTQLIRLEQNYRSTKNILSAADSLIKHNVNQIPKTLWTDNGAGELVNVIECSDDLAEAEALVSEIKSLMENGSIKPKDIAILYRTNAQSLAFENALRKEKISYLIVGGTSFFKRKEIKDTIAYFQALVNPKDEQSLLRIVNEPPRGLGKVSLEHINNYSRANNIGLLQAFSSAGKIADLKPQAKKSASAFGNLIMNYQSQLEDAEPIDLIKNYLEEIGSIKMYEEIGTEDAKDRANNIKQLINDFIRFFEDNEDASFSEYLQQITLLSDIDEADITNNQVKLMTLHSAKGLEFPIVFVVGLEEGLFPLSRANSHPDEIEEERRLCYVGITRAERRLYLSYAKQRMMYGSISTQSPSKFLREIDSNYLSLTQYRRKVGFSGSAFRKKTAVDPSWGSSPKLIDAKSSASSNAFKVGDTVRHNIFGRGKIENISGFGSSKQAVVNFELVGKKLLMLQVAKMHKV